MYFRMDSDTEIKDNLADLVKKDKILLRVDVTAAVEDGRINPSKLGSSSTWNDMEQRLQRDLETADEKMIFTSEQEDKAKANLERFELLKSKAIKPSNDTDKKLLAAGKDKLVRIVAKMENNRQKAYSKYNQSKKQIAEHLKIKSKEVNSHGKIMKINGRYFQWWEGLPAYMSEFQPTKEDPKTLYRRLREILIIDPSLVEHNEIVNLMSRYR